MDAGPTEDNVALESSVADSAVPESKCGDSVCDIDESPLNCPVDCAISCGDSVCDSDESPLNCPVDCAVGCGNGSCDAGESSVNCANDCGASCGDEACNGDESTVSCVSDCGSNCGDGACNGDENTVNCASDCGSECGDGACTGNESSADCSADCGADCGDGKCEAGLESCGSCLADCPCSNGKSCDGESCICGPSPHYKMVDDLCLPSCGALKGDMGWGGTTCCSQGCTAAGGPSWDCDYCCAGTDTCAATTNPDPVEECSAGTLPKDLAGVVWLHQNVSKWPVTAKLNSVFFKGTQICLDYDKTAKWPGVVLYGNADVVVNGNPWIFVCQDNKWYAATWEWLRVKQTCKAVTSVSGSHIKKNPLQSFEPVSGESYHFMVSGLARDPNVTNVKERSNVLKVVWP